MLVCKYSSTQNQLPKASNSRLLLEEKGNLQPINQSAKQRNLLLSPSVVWWGRRGHKIGLRRQFHCLQTALWIDTTPALEQVEWARLLSAYLHYSAVICWISMPLNSVWWGNRKLLASLQVGLGDTAIYTVRRQQPLHRCRTKYIVITIPLIFLDVFGHCSQWEIR